MPFNSEHDSQDSDSSEVPALPLDAHSCQLLSLPAELRNQIYSYHLPYIASALWPGNIIHIDTSSGRIPYGKKMPPILQTCRQIRNEAVGILIESRVFVFFGFGRARSRIDFGWFEPYVSCMRRVELRRWTESTGYKLEWTSGEGLDAYEFQGPTRCESPVLTRSAEVLDRIVAGSKERGRKPALDPARLRRLCKAIVADEEGSGMVD